MCKFNQMLYKKINTLLSAKNLDCTVCVIQLHTMCDVQRPHERPIIVASQTRGRWGSDRPNCTQQTLLFLCLSPWMRKRPGPSSRQFISLHFYTCSLHTPVNFWPPNDYDYSTGCRTVYLLPQTLSPPLFSSTLGWTLCGWDGIDGGAVQ